MRRWGQEQAQGRESMALVSWRVLTKEREQGLASGPQEVLRLEPGLVPVSAAAGVWRGPPEPQSAVLQPVWHRLS